MTIDNLQQPSGESLRERRGEIVALTTDDVDALTQRIIERQKKWNSVFVSPCDAELVRGQFHHSWDWWPWGGIATTEDYR